MKRSGGIRKLAEDKFILDFCDFSDDKSSIKSTQKSNEFSSEKEARDFAEKHNIEVKYSRNKDEA